MKLPRWLVIGMLTTSVLAVLAAAGWWWVKLSIARNIYDIQEPVKLWAGECDCGDLDLKMVDEDGRRLSFCAPRRYWLAQEFGGIFTEADPAKPGAIQLNDDSPEQVERAIAMLHSSRGTIQLEDGGAEQAALLRVLENWIAKYDEKYSSETPDRDHQYVRMHAGEFAKILQERLRPPAGTGEQRGNSEGRP